MTKNINHSAPQPDPTSAASPADQHRADRRRLIRCILAGAPALMVMSARSALGQVPGDDQPPNNGEPSVYNGPVYE